MSQSPLTGDLIYGSGNMTGVAIETLAASKAAPEKTKMIARLNSFRLKKKSFQSPSDRGV
jgi:hypothetical protein